MKQRLVLSDLLFVALHVLFFCQKGKKQPGMKPEIREEEVGQKFDDGEMEHISIFALREAKKCHKGAKISKLHLNYHGGEESPNSYVRRALDSLKTAFAENKTLESALGAVKSILSEIPCGEDDLRIATEQAKDKYFARISAMAQHLWVQTGERSINVPISFEHRGLSFYDKADVVLLNGNGEKRAIIFSLEQSPYSTKARIPDNHPKASIENNFLCAAGVNGEVWYLKSKDEKNDVIPPFEVKAEKNIVSYYVSSEDAMEYLSNVVLNETDCGDCNSCRHASVCQMREVRIDPPAELSGKKEPTFTEEQLRAVNHRDGAMALLAVPGAGKTTVLVHRQKALIESGVPAAQTLFVTFTKKAATEIKERLMALLPEGAELPAIHTFNSFGYTLLKANPMLIGKRVKIADDNDIKGMVRDLLDNAAAEGLVLNASYAGAFLDYGIVSRVAGWFKDIMEHGKEDFTERMGAKIPYMDDLLALYDRYLREFKGNGYITFDEQVTLVNQIFEKYPKIVGKVAAQYQYIMVDEFQDSSEEQAKMIYSIAKCHGNIMVVGDEDQSIYGWRGGSNRFLLRFKDDFPKAEVVIMSDNFRSNDKILAAADSIIVTNTNRVEKSLRGHKNAQNPPLFFKNGGTEELVKIVSQLVRKYRPGDIAILARTNRRLGDVEKDLNGIVKMSTPKDYLINDAVFQIVYDVCSLFYNLKDDVALYRCLTRLGVTEFPEKASAKEALYNAIRSSYPGFSLDRMDIHAYEGYVDCAASAMMQAGKELLAVLKKLQYNRSMEAAFEGIADAFHIPSDHKVFENLLDTCDEHAFVKISELYAYMHDMVIFKSTKRVGYEAADDAVSLLTAHDAKGKEFPVVIIYCTEDFASASEEDNCLLYVAMTRAKNTLIMIEGMAQESVLSIGKVASHVMIRE